MLLKAQTALNMGVLLALLAVLLWAASSRATPVEPRPSRPETGPQRPCGVGSPMIVHEKLQ